MQKSELKDIIRECIEEIQQEAIKTRRVQGFLIESVDDIESLEEGKSPEQKEFKKGRKTLAKKITKAISSYLDNEGFVDLYLTCPTFFGNKKFLNGQTNVLIININSANGTSSEINNILNGGGGRSSGQESYEKAVKDCAQAIKKDKNEIIKFIKEETGKDCDLKVTSNSFKNFRIEVTVKESKEEKEDEK